MLAVSIAAHAAILATARSNVERAAEPPVPAVRSMAESVRARADSVRRALRIRDERAALVQKARRERAAGHLALGAFLLEASRIDAEEAGIELDDRRASDAYAERLASLKLALEEADVTHAVPRAFGDLKYYGQPGGLMASALVDRGGSCEQIAELVGAAVFDAGRPNEIALRYYGGVMQDGAAHLTPIAIDGTTEHDLMTGQIAQPGGLRLPVDELVEIYARAHSLAEPLKQAVSSAKGEGASGARATNDRGDDGAPKRPTIAAGMPPNDDRYPGSLPVYAAHALRDPDEAGGGPGGFDLSEEQQARFCPFYVKLGALSPPSVAFEVRGDDGALTYLEAEPRKIPGPAILEREATLLRAAENVANKSSTDPADRLVDLACLAALGEVAAVDFELAGEHGAARESVRVRRMARERGKAALAAIDWSGDEGAAVARTLLLAYGGQSWILLALEGGERAVTAIGAQARRDMDGWIGVHAALIVWPATRERTISLVAARPLTEQMEVMQAIFLTADRTRYLPGNLDLDGTVPADDASARFLAEYRVFRRLAARLWEGDPPRDTLEAFERDTLANGVDPAGRAALLDYYARNTLALYAQRIEVMPGAPPKIASPHGRVERPMAVSFAAGSDPHAGITGRASHPHAWQREGGMEVVRALKEAVDRESHPSLDRIRRCLGYIEAQGHLDPRTLADGLRKE